MRECCNKCCKDICTNIDVRDLIYKAKLKITELSNCKINELKYGFVCKNDPDFLISKISLQKWVLENSNKFTNCLCLSDINFIKEDLTRIVDCNYLDRKDLIIDKSNQQSWNTENPYCISRERWEEMVYKVCGDLSLEIEIKKGCDFVFDIYSKNISCDLIAGLSVYSKQCEVKFEKNVVSSKECKLQFDKLVKDIPSCDLNYKLYNKLVNKCNVKHNLIAEAYSCGLKFDIDGNCPIIKSKNSSHNLCDFKFKNILYDVSCEFLIDKPNVQKFIREY